MIPNEDGIIEVEFEAEKYSSLLIISCDDNSVT